MFNQAINKQESETLNVKEIAALSFLSYDSAFLINKELVISEFNNVKKILSDNLFGVFNNMVWHLILTQTSQVKLSRSMATLPATKNFESHLQVMRSYSIEHIFELINTSVIESETKHITKSFINQINCLVKSVIEEYFVRNLNDTEREVGFSFKKLINSIDEVKVDFPFYTLNDLNETPRVSLVSSLFRGQRYVYSFLENLLVLEGADEHEIIIVSPGFNLLQDCVLLAASDKYKKIKVFGLSYDPGIYNCWNHAIKNAKGTYISNANLDDRRHKDHVAELVAALDNSDALVAGSGIAVTDDEKQLNPIGYTTTDLINHFSGDFWYFSNDLPQGREFKSLEDFLSYKTNH
ncbi:glycosyltransferase [Shewanella phaeophyticola]|uniref:Glycosyltransferase n=1 Tax=Shewanella phaeophyticola TaxID=2978345 RepID=A0ABT2NZB5_9GAMM|nr:glycosyltransferase [Shewanella sp. KJ10-1]MCT8985737.1 glycosyltransferase [Shewanella sp. KJ10-1]